jgi:hypothetical protein
MNYLRKGFLSKKLINDSNINDLKENYNYFFMILDKYIFIRIFSFFTIL